MRPPVLGRVKLAVPHQSKGSLLGQDQKSKLYVSVRVWTGVPIPGAMVSVWNERLLWRSSALTDEQGGRVVELPWDIQQGDSLEVTVTVGDQTQVEVVEAPPSDYDAWKKFTFEGVSIEPGTQPDDSQPLGPSTTPSSGAEPSGDILGIPTWGWISGGIGVAAVVALFLRPSA